MEHSPIGRVVWSSLWLRVKLTSFSRLSCSFLFLPLCCPACPVCLCFLAGCLCVTLPSGRLSLACGSFLLPLVSTLLVNYHLLWLQWVLPATAWVSGTDKERGPSASVFADLFGSWHYHLDTADSCQNPDGERGTGLVSDSHYRPDGFCLCCSLESKGGNCRFLPVSAVCLLVVRGLCNEAECLVAFRNLPCPCYCSPCWVKGTRAPRCLSLFNQSLTSHKSVKQRQPLCRGTGGGLFLLLVSTHSGGDDGQQVSCRADCRRKSQGTNLC